MRIARPPLAPAYIPTASMADIAFLLIIFFMVTTAFDVDRTRLDLPVSEPRNDVERGAAVLVVAADPSAEGTRFLFSAGTEMSREVSAEELPGLVGQALDRFSRESRRHLFVLKADGATAYRHVDRGLELLRASGAVNVFLLTRERERPR